MTAANKSLQRIPTLLGFHSVHFKAWANNLKADIGYGSQLVQFLRNLAKKLEEGRIKEE